jgi:hypothetical protein
MKNYFCLILFISINFFSYSQDNKEALVWFDNVINQKNLDINSGIKFTKKHATIKGNHTFLFEDKFYNGTVNYDNQMYYNVSLKYDIFEDNLISLTANEFNELSIILNKEKVSFFTINNQKFVKLEKEGFHKELYRNKKTALYQKHGKLRSERKVNNYVYSKYSQEVNYYIHHNNQRHSFNKKKDWLKVFPEKKSIIKSFYKDNKNKFKSNLGGFLVDLIKRIED